MGMPQATTNTMSETFSANEHTHKSGSTEVKKDDNRKNMRSKLAGMFWYTVYDGQIVPAWATMLAVNKHHGRLAVTEATGNAVWENEQVEQLGFYVEIDNDDLLLKYNGRIYHWASCEATL